MVVRRATSARRPRGPTAHHKNAVQKRESSGFTCCSHGGVLDDPMTAVRTIAPPLILERTAGTTSAANKASTQVTVPAQEKNDAERARDEQTTSCVRVTAGAEGWKGGSALTEGDRWTRHRALT